MKWVRCAARMQLVLRALVPRVSQRVAQRRADRRPLPEQQHRILRRTPLPSDAGTLSRRYEGLLQWLRRRVHSDVVAFMMGPPCARPAHLSSGPVFELFLHLQLQILFIRNSLHKYAKYVFFSLRIRVYMHLRYCIHLLYGFRD